MPRQTADEDVRLAGRDAKPPRDGRVRLFLSGEEDLRACLLAALCHILRKAGHLHKRLDELAAGNERPLALHPVHRAERFQLRDGVAHGHAARAVPLAELALRGERLIGLETAVFNGAEEIVAYRFIKRSFLHDARSSVPARARHNR